MAFGEATMLQAVPSQSSLSVSLTVGLTLGLNASPTIMQKLGLVHETPYGSFSTVALVFGEVTRDHDPPLHSSASVWS